VIGEGYVQADGNIHRTADVLARQQLCPIKLGFKEGLALINGTSAMTGTACMALVRAYQILKLALVASADVVQCLGASTRPFEHRGHVLKNHSGQIYVAKIMRQLLAGNKLTREHQDIMKAIYQLSSSQDDVVDSKIYLQDAYSLRCMPQVLGPVLETLNFCRRIIEEEANSTNDNPLFFETPEDTFHGANFHGQYAAMACDYLNIALTEVGVLAERQLNRLVDPHLNASLPAFLACGNTGLLCGFEGAQYLATSIASENLDLAAPSSVKSLPSNGSNQDIVSMGLISARKSLKLVENVTTILTVLVAACQQAAQFIGIDHFSTPIREIHQRLSQVVPLYQDDSPINEHLNAIRAFLTSPEGWAYLDRNVQFSDDSND
jgi:histidine ammonia-lyase